MSPTATESAIPKKLSSQQMCEVLGISQPQLSDLKQRGVITPERRGEWRVEEVTKYCEHMRTMWRSASAQIENAKRGHDVNPDDEDDKHLAEYRKQKARMARYDADLRAGYLVSTSAVKKYLIKMISVARMRMLSVPNRVADVSRPFLKDAKGQDAIRDVVTATVEEVLHELAESAATTGLYDSGGEPRGAGRADRPERQIRMEAAGEAVGL